MNGSQGDGTKAGTCTSSLRCLSDGSCKVCTLISNNLTFQNVKRGPSAFVAPISILIFSATSMVHRAMVQLLVRVLPTVYAMLMGRAH